MCSENTVPSHVLQPLFTEGRVCVSFTALTDFIVLNLAHFSSLSDLGTISFLLACYLFLPDTCLSQNSKCTTYTFICSLTEMVMRAGEVDLAAWHSPSTGVVV